MLREFREFINRGNLVDIAVGFVMGAAFSALGGSDTDESVPVMLHPGLDPFLGTDTAAGTTLMSAIGADTPVARIHVSLVPEPTGISLLASGVAFALLRLRRTRTK